MSLTREGIPWPDHLRIPLDQKNMQRRREQLEARKRWLRTYRLRKLGTTA